MLTDVETYKLDSIKFDKKVVLIVKENVNTTFKVVKVINNSGKIIPEDFIPKLVKFDLDYLMVEGKFNLIKSKFKSRDYSIHKIISEGKTSIIISKH